MGYFSVDQANALIGETVRMATLVDFEFSDTPVYVWNGFGTRTFNSKSYLGVGDLGSIDGLEESRGAVSHQVTFTLSGVPDSPAGILARAISSIDVVQGNLAIVSVQLFYGDWSMIGLPVPVYAGRMMPPRVTKEAATETDGARRTIMLPTENIFYGRHRPPSGRFTDREQQQRWPGDLFCEHIPKLINLSLNWPDY